MSPAERESPNWTEVSDLLDRAFEMPDSQRGPWLDQICAGRNVLRQELESLLAADQQAEKVFTNGQSLGADHGLAATISALGSRLGPYELIKPIARGGMGQVFLAKRVDGEFEQKVAIKLLTLQLDDNAQRRFHAESQHLARLDHPHIVRLIDAGVADSGVNYLVLQYVEGQTVDQWSQTSGASLRQRMALFVQLCDAVVHAHQHLIVHRDIKPSNVLVSRQEQGKLLDFGISRGLDDEHTATSSLMTPRFAAPEQILGQPFTTATDVYGLGVIAHLLLTGQAPYADDDASLDALAARTRRREPPVPSGLPSKGHTPLARRRLRGDLDAMLLKCLQTDPTHRYESVAALRDDAQAWLAGEELKARRPGLARRLGRFFLRYRWPTTAAAAFVFSAVTAATYHWQTVSAQRDAAVASNDFLVNLTANINPYRRSADDALVMPLSEFFVAGLDGLESSRIPPRGKAKLALAFAKGLTSIDAADEALAAADKALAWTADEASLSQEALRALQQRARALTALNRYDEAKLDYQALMSHIGQQVPELSVWSASIYLNFGACLVAAGDVAQSLDLFDRSLKILPPDTQDDESQAMILMALMLQAGAQSRLGRHEEAQASSSRQVELASAWYGTSHIEYVRALGQAVTVGNYDPGNQAALAEQAYRASVRVLGPEHSETQSMHNNFALALSAHDETSEQAVVEFQRLIELRQKTNTPSGDAHQNLAATLRAMGRFDEAWEQTERAKEDYEESLGSGHWRLSMPLLTQADLALADGRAELAYDRAQHAIKILDQQLGSAHYAARVARSMAMAAKTVQQQCTPQALILSNSDLDKTAAEIKGKNRPHFLAHLERGRNATPC